MIMMDPGFAGGLAFTKILCQKSRWQQQTPAGRQKLFYGLSVPI